MQLRWLPVFLVFFSLGVSARSSFGFELKTQYATIIYEREELLRKFNKEISLGSLSYLMRHKKSVTADDEIRNKLDVIVERVEAILDMFPGDLKFRIVLLSSESEVQRIYKMRYGTAADYIAFYAPKDKTLYISVDDIRLGVLAHELTHAVLDHYFGVSPPVKVHEVLAQFVETQLKD
ncbi:MAG: hypothetical protein HZA17_06255 [Nitrospirae bacterium]|nr:hypothetical protein [Nitrospirota bacterium]